MVDVDQDLAGVVSILTLGVGLLALFAGIDQFWMIFVIGWVVLTPLAGMLADDDAAVEETGVSGVDRTTPADGTTDGSTTDALETLRDRYARGELTEEQFERKVDRLLRTETPEDARDRLGAGDDTDWNVDLGTEVDAEPASERDREREPER